MIEWTPLVISHIITGSVALGSGTVAAVAPKGGQLHRRSGHWFLGSMGIMCATGTVLGVQGVLAADVFEGLAALVGVFSLYLLATGWRAAQQRTPVWQTPDTLLAVLGAVLVAAFASLIWVVVQDPDGGMARFGLAPPIMFTSLTGLALVCDLLVARAGGLKGPARIARHLWRVGLAFYLANSSFFLGQADEFPEPIASSPLLAAPPLAALALILVGMITVGWLPGLRQLWRAQA